MSKNITDIFIREMCELSRRKLPRKVIAQAKMCVMDYVCCAFLGESMLRKENSGFLRQTSGDCGGSVIIGAGKRATVHNAAMLNGMNAHMAELDDGHRYGMMHPGTPVISALFAVAGDGRLSGEQFLRGVVCGYEAAIRLASAIQPGHKLKGFHATGTCGTVGAAVGVAAAFGYTEDQMKATVSAACTDAAGLLEVIDDGSRLKPYNIGRAAAAGVDAAMTGLCGLNGPDDILGGKRGFLKNFAGDIKISYITDGFGDACGIERIYRKPYAACRHCHPAIEAAVNAAGEKRQEMVNDIEEVRIETYGLAVGGHDHREVRGSSSAKMSTPYSVAVALLYGKADFQQFTDAYLGRPEIAKLMGKITVEESPELSALVPEKRGAAATIRTKEETFYARVDYPKGEPENPVTEEELKNKFFSLAEASGKSREYASEILERIFQMETQFSALTAAL